MMYPNCGLNELLIHMYTQFESELISELYTGSGSEGSGPTFSTFAGKQYKS